MKELRLTALDSGLFRVSVDGADMEGGHVTEREATQRSVNHLIANPSAVVKIRHDYEALVELVDVPPPSPGPAAVFEELWDYPDLGALHAAPHVVQYTPGNHAAVDFVRGQHVEVQFAAGQGSGGVDLMLPNVGRRIWIEVPIQYGPGYAVPQDDKTIFLFDEGGSGSNRWTYHVGVFGHGIQFQPDTASGAQTAPSEFSGVADQLWHTHRLLADLDTGEAKVWVDGRVVLDQTFGPRGGDPAHGFGKASLHRNNNHGQQVDTWLRYGHFRLYNSDPGW